MQLSKVNPYQVKAGAELDRLVHRHVLGRPDSETAGECPNYSTDEVVAREVLAKLKSLVHSRVTVGQTRLRDKRWFARYETNPSDGTEVFGESRPLAICRLALLHAIKNQED